MSPSQNDDLEAGYVGRRERLRALYAERRLDLLRLADLLGAEAQPADDAVENAFLALARRPWVRSPATFLEHHVVRRCPSPPEQRELVLRYRSGDRSLDSALARRFATQSMSVVAGPPRLETGLQQRAKRRRRAGAVTLVLAVVVTAAVLTVRVAVRPRVQPPVPAVPAVPPAEATPLAPAVDVPAPDVGTVPLGRYGLAVLADPGVEVLDATGGQTALLSSASEGATALGVSHDGRYVAALVGSDTVDVLDQRDDLVWSGQANLAVWSPAANTLALAGPTGVRFLTLGATGTPEYVTTGPAGALLGAPTGLAWRPDGATVAVGTNRELALLSPTGQRLSSVAAPAGTTLDPVTWTADSTHVLVFDEPDGTALNTYGVRVLSAGVTNRGIGLGQQLGATVPQPGWWSADGRTSVLGVLGTGHGAVEEQRVVRCDLTAGTCATLASGADVDPVATASGIAYLSARGSFAGDTVMLAGADGSHARAAPGAPVAEQLLADGDVLLLAGTTGIYRYDAGRTDLLTTIDTDGAPDQNTEIVSWQPNARSNQ